jgi:hypothetical protein
MIRVDLACPALTVCSGEDDFIDYDSDDGPVLDAPRTNSDADPYARMLPAVCCRASHSLFHLSGVFFSKDHREEIIEVEEEPELVHLPESGAAPVKLMTQGEWMKGCPPPSGGEQSFLFALYSQLSEGKCVCPHECGSSVLRTKSDFFPIFVRRHSVPSCPPADYRTHSPSLLRISHICNASCQRLASGATPNSALPAANR